MQIRAEIRGCWRLVYGVSVYIRVRLVRPDDDNGYILSTTHDSIVLMTQEYRCEDAHELIKRIYTRTLKYRYFKRVASANQS